MPSHRPKVTVISTVVRATLPSPPAPRDDAAVFLDIDGTLLDFAINPHPVIDPVLRADLAALRTRLDGAVALVSGRPVATLDELFDWQGHAVAGVHGGDLRTPDGRHHYAGDPERFARVRERAAVLAAAAPDIWLEDKRVGLGLFYQGSPAHAEAIAGELLQLAGAGYLVMRGKHGVELRAADADKGTALDALMATPAFRGRTPWMLGDDAPDENAFARANAAGGISVVVGERRPTHARYTLRNPAATRAWLHAWATARA